MTIETVNGPVSGFINREELKQTEDQATVRGVIRNIAKEHLEVWINGSFFTTNGIADVRKELAMAA